jgi:lysyl-tRNA synthetase, class I
MIWADRLREEIKERFKDEIAQGKELVIRDEKTLSGRVHVGSLRGIVIHGVIAEILQEEGIKCKFEFELNEFDPMDGLPSALDKKKYKEHMGKPLFTIPSPTAEEIKSLGMDISPGENFTSIFAEEIKGVVEKINLPIEFYNLLPLYKEGKFNECIKDALENAPAIRKIYKEVSGGGKPDDWYPLQVVCEKCGRTGTTKVTGWDGTNVTYRCEKDMVTWAKGCEHVGSMNPFDGNGKLPWKVEWAAKWKVLGVHIEGCGKDHSAAGGSRSIAKRISEEIFDYPNPFDIPYEFLNLGGKKMSASKGIGASAKEVSDMLPGISLKLLMMRLVPNRPIDFDPTGKTIPNLFDEYDRLSDHFFKRHREPDEDFARSFKLCQMDISKDPEDLWQMRFSVLSFVLQMPHLDLLEEATKLKGSDLTKEEGSALEERASYVKAWIETFAPEEYKFEILEKTPSDLELDDEQKTALEKLSTALEKAEWEGEEIHKTIHETKEETGIAPKKLFQPLYEIFLGRKSGPQIGWFLSTIEKGRALEMISSA